MRLLDKTGLPLSNQRQLPHSPIRLLGGSAAGESDTCIPLHDCANTRQDSNTIQLYLSTSTPTLADTIDNSPPLAALAANHPLP